MRRPALHADEAMKAEETKAQLEREIRQAEREIRQGQVVSWNAIRRLFKHWHKRLAGRKLSDSAKLIRDDRRR